MTLVLLSPIFYNFTLSAYSPILNVCYSINYIATTSSATSITRVYYFSAERAGELASI